MATRGTSYIHERAPSSSAGNVTTPDSADDHVTPWHGAALDVLRDMPDGSLDSCVTSPPYFGLRDYGVEGQYGLESSPAEYVERMRQVFAEVRRVLADDGTLWLNLGDSYSGAGPSGATYDSATTRRRAEGDGTDGVFRVSKRLGERGLDYSRKKPKPTGGIPSKNLLGIPWRVAFALQDDGWILRNAIIWHKPNAMPESVTDRLSTRYEHVFLFSKSRRYFFDLDPIREPLAYPDDDRVLPRAVRGEPNGQQPQRRRMGNRYGAARPWSNSEQGDDHDAADPRGRNPGDVWEIATQPFSGAHFAVMPLALAERCVLAGCKPSGTVL